jgi:hypothetical protein
MSWQDDVMIEQERADALEYMGEAEWRDMYKDDITHKHANPEVTKALDGKEKDGKR